MENKLIVGNWKSNKTVAQSIEWFRAFSWGFHELESQVGEKGFSVVICAPYTHLYPLQKVRDEIGIKVELGAQDISPYPEGAYTGQINASMLAGLVSWVIIGHSERRKYFHETDTELTEKVKMAKNAGLQVIYCVSDDVMPVPDAVDVVAYEPVWAIGTGKTDTPENAQKVILNIKNRTKNKRVIYGGSVTADNVAGFTQNEIIDGVLPGGASLKHDAFLALVKNALV